MTPTIIEVALSGMGGKARNPHMPVSPEEIAADIITCIDAGAGVVHNHIDDYLATGEAAANRYGEAWRIALAERPEAILYGTLATFSQDPQLGKYSHMVDTVLRHGARMGVLDTGSLNLCASTPDGQPNTQFQVVYDNDYATLDRVLIAYAAERIPSSIAVYDPTFLRATLAYHRAGRLMPGSFVKLYFGGERCYLDGQPGVSFGLPPTRKALETYLEMLEGCDLPWAVAVLGGDLWEHREFVQAVLAHGGHLRVGLEDYAGERTPANAELVAEVAALAREFGRPPASPAETAALLGIPPRC